MFFGKHNNKGWLACKPCTNPDDNDKLIKYVPSELVVEVDDEKAKTLCTEALDDMATP